MTKDSTAPVDLLSTLAMVQENLSWAASRIRNLSDSCQWTECSETIDTKKFREIIKLADEIFEWIFQYLCASELITLSQTCLKFRKIALSNQLWRSHFFNRLSAQIDRRRFSIYDEPSYVQLVPYVDVFPTCFDVTQTPPNEYLSFHEENLYVSRRGINTGVLGVQYSGDVGTGNRCLRTDCPFPSSYNWDRQSPAARGSRHGISATSLHMMYRLLRAVHYSTAQPRAAAAALSLIGATSSGYNIHSVATTPVPFCLPVMLDCGKIDITPHYVSYFEIEISQGEDHMPHTEADCIAIGLSNCYFPMEGKMPGWDSNSYGYHSDDGGVFHLAGSMQYRYGPTFGVGDVVGCGLDYTHGRGITADIFFTLNGNYLGVAFEKVDANYLYPTVGIDSKLKIHLNLGHQKPFKFNVFDYEKRQLADAIFRAKQESLAVEAAWAARQHRAATLCPLLIGAAALPALAMSRGDSH